MLSRDDYYADALASQYLAGWLTTGTLLTPTSHLAAATVAAIRAEGINHVCVTGGPLAVSTTVLHAIEALPAYGCGGVAEAGATVQVTRIAGATAEATAQSITSFVTRGFVGSTNLAPAYGVTNPTGGSGRFNATAGISSASASPGTLRTAILATGASFQDAESASVISYAQHLPILLTTPATLSPQAAGAVATLNISQMIVMGGPLAISDGVVAQLQAMGISVLRVAGPDATATAIEAADLEMSPVGLGWAPASGLVVARGTSFSDGLAGAVVAAGAGSDTAHGADPLVLTESPSTLGPHLSDFLATAGSKGIAGNGRPVTSLRVLGGRLAITTATVTAMLSALSG